MKKLLLIFFSLFTTSTQANMIVQDFSLLPGNDVTSTTDIFASYSVYTANLSSLYNPSQINVFDRNITIDIFILESMLTEVGGVSENLLIGQLSEGTYNVTANFYYNIYSADPVLHTSLTEHLNVTDVPIPASLWLFLSGLIILFKRKENS